jgi:hypothetical protein
MFINCLSASPTNFNEDMLINVNSIDLIRQRGSTIYAEFFIATKLYSTKTELLKVLRTFSKADIKLIKLSYVFDNSKLYLPVNWIKEIKYDRDGNGSDILLLRNNRETIRVRESFDDIKKQLEVLC